jgi:hypothetical protein
MHPRIPFSPQLGRLVRTPIIGLALNVVVAHIEKKFSESLGCLICEVVMAMAYSCAAARRASVVAYSSLMTDSTFLRTHCTLSDLSPFLLLLEKYYKRNAWSRL